MIVMLFKTRRILVFLYKLLPFLSLEMQLASPVALQPGDILAPVKVAHDLFLQ